jgi:hypothetical protein
VIPFFCVFAAIPGFRLRFTVTYIRSAGNFMKRAPADPSPAFIPWAVRGRNLRYLVIFVIAFVGKFLFASQFGFYEDDYLQILPAYQYSLWDAISTAWGDLQTWQHGEPIGFFIADLHAYFVTRFDTLLVGFLLGLILVALNGCLFYQLARRFLPDFPAFVAACVFVLYPADTSEQIIMNQPWQLMNLTLVLLAFLFYRRNITLSYGLALCSLLTYEHFFFPFAAAPFFLRRGERFSFKSCLSHAFFIVISATCLILVRDFIGDPRAREVTGSPGEVFTKIPTSIGLGLSNSVSTLFNRISDALVYGGSLSWGMTILTGLSVALMFLRKNSADTVSENEPEHSWRQLLVVAAGALFAAAAGYALAFRPDNYPPILNLGRLSGFNAPASIGICILIGCAVTAISRLSAITREIVAWVSAGAVGALVAVGVYIQQVDYVASWDQQRSVLQQLFATSNTWNPDTVLVIDLDNSDLRSMSTPGFPVYWVTIDLSDVLSQLVHSYALREFTKDHHASPIAIGYSREITSVVAEPGGVSLEMADHAPIHVKDGNFQLFQVHDGRLTRVHDPVWAVANIQLHQQILQPTHEWPLPLSKAGTILLQNPPVSPPFNGGIHLQALWPSVGYGIMYPTNPPFSRIFPPQE